MTVVEVFHPTQTLVHSIDSRLSGAHTNHMTDQRPTSPTRRTLTDVLAILNTIDFHETMAAHASDWLGRADIAQDTINRHQDAVDEFRQGLDQIAVEHGLDVDQLTALAQRQVEHDFQAEVGR